VINGLAETIFPELKTKYNISTVDFVFMDHWKHHYKNDLLRLEKEDLLDQGSVIAADNVIFPGAPDYLEYVRNSPLYKSVFHPGKVEYTSIDDGIEESVYQQKR